MMKLIRLMTAPGFIPGIIPAIILGIIPGIGGELHAGSAGREPFEVRIFTDRYDYVYGDKILLHVLFVNQSGKDVQVARAPALTEYNLHLIGSSVSDWDIVRTESPYPAGPQDFVTVRSGQSFDRIVDLTQTAREKLQNGEYSLFVYDTYTAPPRAANETFRSTLKSNTIRFRYRAGQDLIDRVQAFDLYAGRRIAYVYGKIGDSRIYLIDIDGKDQRRLTDLDTDESSPAWSPDGQRIAFIAGSAEDQEIYVTDPSGGTPVRLTSIGGSKRSLSWAPDGKKIVFAARLYADWEIYTVGLDDLSLINLTNHPAHDMSPAWSPDGYHIAFVSSRGNRPGETGYENRGQVYLMSPDGVYVRKLAAGRDCYVVDDDEKLIVNLPPRPWSMDSQQLIYKTGSCQKDCNSCLANVYDGQIRAVFSQGRGIFFPDWSYDNSKIVYNHMFNGQTLIAVVNHEGTRAKTLRKGAYPVWADEAAMIVFAAQAEGSANLYAMTAEGEDVHRLTDYGLDGPVDDKIQIRQIAVNEHANLLISNSPAPGGRR